MHQRPDGLHLSWGPDILRESMTFTYALQACVLLVGSVYAERRTAAMAVNAVDAAEMSVDTKPLGLRGIMGP